MRLIATFEEKNKAGQLAYFLNSQKIDTAVEQVADAEQHGKLDYQLWVVDEDRVDEALAFAREFEEDPGDARFAGYLNVKRQLDEAEAKGPKEEPQQRRSGFFPGTQKMGRVTIALILISILAYIWGVMGTLKQKTPEPEGITVIASPVYQVGMYDFPAAFELYNELAATYTAEELADPQTLPPAGKVLLQKANTAPYWQGAYTEFFDRYKDPNQGWQVAVPLFEKISEGEVWRLFTPCLLHGGFLHIFFNVLWMLVLGNQVEARLGPVRYGLLALIAGVLSNTAQYLMSGPLFFGLSGIVCGLFGFIWMRQRKAPWEGYQLNRPTLIFISIFLFGMLGLQLASFFMELVGANGIRLGIANTAHITGIIAGILMGRMKVFAIRERSKRRT